MALTAITSVSNVARTVFGNKRIVVGSITYGDGINVIPALGLPLLPATIGISTIDLILFEVKSSLLYYDYTTNCIIPVGTGAGNGLKLNVAGAGVIPASGEVIRFIAIGDGVA